METPRALHPGITMRPRHVCRVCGGAELEPFGAVPGIPLTDEHVDAARAGGEFVAAVRLAWCPRCAMVQTDYDLEVGDYYRDYTYAVSGSGFASAFQVALAGALVERFGLRAGDGVVEIGSSDGGQLAAFLPLGMQVLGFEPAEGLCDVSEAAGVPVVRGLFHAGTAGAIAERLGGPAQAVLLAYTLDHIPEPRDVLRGIADVLDPERGIVVVEVHDFAETVRRRETCLFAHEHTIYPHAGTLARLFQRSGLRMIATGVLPDAVRRGNSLLAVAAAETSAWPACAVDPGLARYDRAATYADVARRIGEGGARVRGFVEALHAEGRVVAGYGAAGRGSGTLAHAGLTPIEIPMIADRNAALHGLLLPATHIPVVSPETLAAAEVDDVLVFSYGYIEEIRRDLAPLTARGARIHSLLDVLADGRWDARPGSSGPPGLPMAAA